MTEYERLVEDVAKDEGFRDALSQYFHRGDDDSAALIASTAIALIAERTKAATDAMIDAYMKTTLGHCPDKEWSAMHAASALWPPRGEETK